MTELEFLLIAVLFIMVMIYREMQQAIKAINELDELESKLMELDK